MVIDGAVGFTGGVGIADLWRGNAESPEHWRDNHYRVTGPVVAEMQAAFMDNWMQTTGEVLPVITTFRPWSRWALNLHRSAKAPGPAVPKTCNSCS